MMNAVLVIQVFYVVAGYFSYNHIFNRLPESQNQKNFKLSRNMKFISQRFTLY